MSLLDTIKYPLFGDIRNLPDFSPEGGLLCFNELSTSYRFTTNVIINAISLFTIYCLYKSSVGKTKKNHSY